MSGRWFRFYDGVLDDPKAQKLPPELFKAWVNLLCLASRNGGNIPVDDVAFALRVTNGEARAIICDLEEAGLIDEFDGLYAPHNWDARQFKSDVEDPTAADRMRRYRSKHRNGDPSAERNDDRNADRNATVTVTVPRAEQIQNRTEQKDLVARKRAPSTKHLLPDDWRPSGEPLSVIEEAEFEKMRDWAKAGAIKRADWNAQWRNWKRNSGNFQPRQAHGTTQGNDFKRALAALSDSIDADSRSQAASANIVRLLPGGGRE
jgi:hypothetical protein